MIVLCRNNVGLTDQIDMDVSYAILKDEGDMVTIEDKFGKALTVSKDRFEFIDENTGDKVQVEINDVNNSPIKMTLETGDSKYGNIIQTVSLIINKNFPITFIFNKEIAKVNEQEWDDLIMAVKTRKMKTKTFPFQLLNSTAPFQLCIAAVEIAGILDLFRTTPLENRFNRIKGKFFHLGSNGLYFFDEQSGLLGLTPAALEARLKELMPFNMVCSLVIEIGSKVLKVYYIPYAVPIAVPKDLRIDWGKIQEVYQEARAEK